MAGVWVICFIPKRAMLANQIAIMGPKIMPTLLVPLLWMRNKPVKIAIVMGTM